MAEIEADVAVYGGGHGGAFVAKSLSEKGHRVVLVDKNDYIENCSATVRNLVVPGFADRAIVKFSDALPKVEFVHGRLVSLEQDGTGVVERGNETLFVKARAAVLCTGQRYKDTVSWSATEYTSEARLNFYKEYVAKVKASKDIVIVGAGPVSVEFAAEVVSQYDDKKVTVVSSESRVLPNTAESASAVAQNVFNGKLTVLDNTRVESQSAEGVILSNGQSIPADLVFWGVGGRPNSEYMAAHWSEAVNEKGEILVSPQFLVKGAKNVFAFADVAHLDGEPKLAWLTGQQWPICAHNVDQFLTGSQAYKAYRTHPHDQRIGVTLGPRKGVFQLPYVGTVAWDWFARLAKSGDMMVGSFRKSLGV